MTTEAEEQPLVPPTWVELESNLPLPKAAKIAGPSPEGLKRHYPKYVKRIGERRDFMKLKHALGIADGTIPAEELPETAA
jgi:hypothetical protein